MKTIGKYLLVVLLGALFGWSVAISSPDIPRISRQRSDLPPSPNFSLDGGTR